MRARVAGTPVAPESLGRRCRPRPKPLANERDGIEAVGTDIERHLDALLSASERAAGDVMMICRSRAAGGLSILDM